MRAVLLTAFLAAASVAWCADPFPGAIAQVDEAVVTVTVPRGGKESLGSGFLVSTAGLLVTNTHVVGKAHQAKVELQDGSELQGTVMARSSSRDLCLISIDRKHLPAVVFGSSASLLKGEQVAALGAPLGLEQSATRGSISDPSRVEDGKAYIQLDVDLNPGNSGGPLINSDGQVVGMSTMVAKGASGVGFAIPAEDICRFLDAQGVAYGTALAASGGSTASGVTGAQEPTADPDAKPAAGAKAGAQPAKGAKAGAAPAAPGGKAGAKAKAAPGTTAKPAPGAKGKAEAKPAPSATAPPASKAPASKAPALWMVVLISAVVSLVISVLVGALTARATVRSITRGAVPPGQPGGGGTGAAPGDDLSDVDIQLY